MKNLMIRPSRIGLPSHLDSFIDDFFRAPFWDDRETRFVPAVDVGESESEFTLTFELPGIEKKDITIQVDDNVLTVSGERRFERQEKSDNCIRSEIAAGSFSRSFNLPRTVDAGKISAEYKDGLLVVTLAKSEAAKPKQIEVKVS